MWTASSPASHGFCSVGGFTDRDTFLGTSSRCMVFECTVIAGLHKGLGQLPESCTTDLHNKHFIPT